MDTPAEHTRTTTSPEGLPAARRIYAGLGYGETHDMMSKSLT